MYYVIWHFIGRFGQEENIPKFMVSIISFKKRMFFSESSLSVDWYTSFLGNFLKETCFLRAHNSLDMHARIWQFLLCEQELSHI